MRDPVHHGVLITAGVLCLLTALYVGSYLILVDTDNLILVLDPSSPQGIGVSPTYHCGDSWGHRVYWPLWMVDRRLRPDVWSIER